ncbi:hypothetical protein ACFVAE_16860 [Microbacterium sp. NPDC057659]|uniref:hypothetical protein n=1 Tax=Microbacterium sp. NPDC057659 TaxID=3346198 RepID=UPI003671E712
MGASGRRQPDRLWVWVLVLILAPVVVFLTFADQVGRCEDPAPGVDAIGCAVEPAVGMPAAIAIAIACLVLLALAVIRVILLSLRRAGAA